MILIDLVYLNSPVGLNLARYLLNYLLKNENPNQFLLLIDKRNSIHFNRYEIKKVTVSKNELSRFLFYKKNVRQFKSVFCFGNVPPPFKIKPKTLIYFHNEILLNSKGLGFSIIKKLLFRLKWIYIKSRNLNYIWFVQTEHMKILLKKKLKVNSNSILKSPIFNSQKGSAVSENKNSFIYPTSNHPHKNNKRLIEAFVEAASRTEEFFTLSLTIDKIKLTLPKNLKINFLGFIGQDQLSDIYNKSQFLIFPSLKESFGLPLIEGIQANCNVIASNLNYVNELVNPSYTFDPYDKKSITETILVALSNKNHPKSTIKIKNSIDLIFKKLGDV